MTAVDKQTINDVFVTMLRVILGASSLLITGLVSWMAINVHEMTVSIAVMQTEIGTVKTTIAQYPTKSDVEALIKSNNTWQSERDLILSRIMLLETKEK